MSEINDFWAFAPSYRKFGAIQFSAYSYGLSKAELVETSLDIWMHSHPNDLGLALGWLLELMWFWFWLWIGLERFPDEEPFCDEDGLAYSIPEFNPAASAHSGPLDACDWYEWVAVFPAPGFVVKQESNY